MKITIETDADIESISIQVKYTGTTKAIPSENIEINNVEPQRVYNDSRESLDSIRGPSISSNSVSGKMLDIPDVTPIDGDVPGMQMDEL